MAQMEQLQTFMKTSSYRGLINKYMPVLLAGIVFLIINTAFKSSGDPFRDGKLNFLIPAMCLYGVYFIYKKINRIIAAAMSICVIHWALLGSQLYGLMFVAGSICVLIVSYKIAEKKELAMNLLRVTIWIQVIYGISQLLGAHIWADKMPYFGSLAYGSIGHPTGYGIFLGILFPMAFYYFSFFECLVLIALILINFKAVPILALVSGFFYLSWRELGNKVLVAFMPVVAGLALCSYLFPEIKFFSFDGRFFIWGEAWRNLNLIGHGPGSWFGLYQNWGINYHNIWDYLHNDWLQLLFECGLGVFIICVYGFIKLSITLPKQYGMSLFIMGVGAMGEFPFHIASTAMVFCVILCLGIIEMENKDALFKKTSQKARKKTS